MHNVPIDNNTKSTTIFVMCFTAIPGILETNHSSNKRVPSSLPLNSELEARAYNIFGIFLTMFWRFHLRKLFILDLDYSLLNAKK